MVSKFNGADDVYLTKSCIAVRKVKSTSKGLEDKTQYFPKTAENLKMARSIFGWIRKGRK